MLKIGRKSVGLGQPCFIIAEAGINHNGNLKLAHRLIDAAKSAGADAVKFQTFKAERLVAPGAPKADYQVKAGVKGSHYEMLRRLELSEKAHRDLRNYAKRKKIIFLSSPFDEESANFLERLHLPAFKIPSGEITNLPFLRHVARKKKPMIVSTGMSYLSEVRTAVRTIEAAGNKNLVLLHCVSQYPANPAEVNLKAMLTLKKIFGFPVGYSDHTLGIEIAIAAVAMGACVVEKHLTLDRTLRGPDHKASLEPTEFTTMVRGIRNVESAFGNGIKKPAKSEANTAAVARKSLVATRDIAAGTKLKKEHLAVKRPGTGLPPAMLVRLVGRTTRKKISAGSLIRLEMIR